MSRAFRCPVCDGELPGGRVIYGSSYSAAAEAKVLFDNHVLECRGVPADAEWDFEKFVGCWELDDGETAGVDGHVDVDAAVRSWHEHQVAMAGDPGWCGDLDQIVGSHVHATDPDGEGEWMWFHTEPHAGSVPVTLLQYGGYTRLPASPPPPDPVDEVKALKTWKREAIEVLEGWDRVVETIEPLPSHLGRLKSDVVAEELVRLRSQPGPKRLARPCPLNQGTSQLMTDWHKRFCEVSDENDRLSVQVQKLETSLFNEEQMSVENFNQILENAPESFDGDYSIDYIALQYVRHLEAEVERLTKAPERPEFVKWADRNDRLFLHPSSRRPNYRGPEGYIPVDGEVRLWVRLDDCPPHWQTELGYPAAPSVRSDPS